MIPQSTLAFSTAYAFEATGLKDEFGNAVAVPAVTFTTQAETVQTMNLDALIFSYPVNGQVTMTAPAGALPSGTQIMVLNSSNGAIVTYTVGDLPVSATLPASIDDRLLVTVTDPQGNTQSFERTEYVAPDGKTAVGVAGGKVRGPEGSELRLPAGATDGPSRSSSRRSRRATCPPGSARTCPTRHFGAGLKIESADKPTFKKEVDLVFPKPADAPPGAFYYVYRKIDLPGGRVAFETLDQAFVEGEQGGHRLAAVQRVHEQPRASTAARVGWEPSAVGGQLRGAHMWTLDEMHARPRARAASSRAGSCAPASIRTTRRARRTRRLPGAVVTRRERRRVSPARGSAAATTPPWRSRQADGTYTLIDARYTRTGSSP